MVGDDPQSDGLHVSVNKEMVTDMPFSYPFYSDNHAIFLILSGASLILKTGKKAWLLNVSNCRYLYYACRYRNVSPMFWSSFYSTIELFVQIALNLSS